MSGQLLRLSDILIEVQQTNRPASNQLLPLQLIAHKFQHPISLPSRMPNSWRSIWGYFCLSVDQDKDISFRPISETMTAVRLNHMGCEVLVEHNQGCTPVATEFTSLDIGRTLNVVKDLWKFSDYETPECILVLYRQMAHGLFQQRARALNPASATAVPAA